MLLVTSNQQDRQLQNKHVAIVDTTIHTQKNVRQRVKCVESVANQIILLNVVDLLSNRHKPTTIQQRLAVLKQITIVRIRLTKKKDTNVRQVNMYNLDQMQTMFNEWYEQKQANDSALIEDENDTINAIDSISPKSSSHTIKPLPR